MASPLTDFKIIRVTRPGAATTVVARFYEGDVAAALEKNIKGVDQLITRYRRAGKISESTFDFAGNKTDAEIFSFLCGELAKDLSRTAIDPQKL